jgi:hypothetical protein
MSGEFGSLNWALLLTFTERRLTVQSVANRFALCFLHSPFSPPNSAPQEMVKPDVANVASDQMWLQKVQSPHHQLYHAVAGGAPDQQP